MSDLSANLVTTCAFKEGSREYVTKMRVVTFGGGCQRSLELTVTDKHTAEIWQSSYDTAYIENLTQKTGNYKQFDVFVAMLQSGLLKTSQSITLDLLTFEDLEMLRARRSDTLSMKNKLNKSSNRRYLILTYNVEFDRIHYPLPLDYCGPPDPAILQATIRKLETEIERLKSSGINKDLNKRIEQLTIANKKLAEENHRLSSSGKGMRRLLTAVKSLENTVAKERASFRSHIQRLRAENAALSLKLRRFTDSSLSSVKMTHPFSRRRSPSSASSSSRPARSRSPSISSRLKSASLSRGSSMDSLRSRSSSRSRRRPARLQGPGIKEMDFGSLESRIQILQKMLKEGINLN